MNEKKLSGLLDEFRESGAEMLFRYSASDDTYVFRIRIGNFQREMRVAYEAAMVYNLLPELLLQRLRKMLEELKAAKEACGA